jgi:hypothetical protein
MLFTGIAATDELLLAPYIFLHIELLISHFGIGLFQQQSEVGKGQC